MRPLFLTVVCFLFLSTAPALAATCGNGPNGFEAWKQDFIANSKRYGLKQRTVNSALQNVKYNSKVIRLDRNQKSFKLSFQQFYAKRVNNAMIRRGQKLGKTYARLESQGDTDAGRKSAVMFRAAMQTHPQNYLAANELGVRLARDGHYQQAGEVLRMAARRPEA